MGDQDQIETAMGGASLDPQDWSALRRQGHQMLDDMFSHMQRLRDAPLWQVAPGPVRARFRDALPHRSTPVETVHDQFMRDVAPYASGNAHPGFMGWVQGGGTAVGMLAEMLAAGLNANVGGRDHMAIEVERQVIAWMAELFGFPADAGGIFLTGASMANFCGVLIAKTRALGCGVRSAGLGLAGASLTAYTSAAAHGCVRRAMEMAGLGSDALRLIPVDAHHRMDTAALRQAITEDRNAGLTPFLVVGSAGTVDIGAIDDLEAIATIASAEGLHFHVDGAYGALAILTPEFSPRLAGLRRADSIAFDFHKWAQVPYDAGFLLVRDAALHRQTFATEAAYLRRASEGLAGGDWWPCDFGPDLSRGFRALKVWFTLKTFGLDRIAAVISHSCGLAGMLGAAIGAVEELELLAPIQLNIVCFGYRCADPDATNAAIVETLHAEGRVAPSVTTISGRLAIRAAFVNHRTQRQDVEALVLAVVAAGRALDPARAAPDTAIRAYG